MPIFRATVYVLTGMAAACDGDGGIVRKVIELSANDVGDFLAQVQDQYIDDVDTDVSFGPITEKTSHYRLKTGRV